MAAVSTAVLAATVVAGALVGGETARQQKDATNEAAKHQKLEQERLLGEEKSRIAKEEKDRQRLYSNQRARERGMANAGPGGGRRSTILTAANSIGAGSTPESSGAPAKTLLGM